MSHTQGKLIQTIPKETEILGLIDKHTESTVLNMFKELKEIMSKEWGEKRSHQLQTIKIHTFKKIEN